MRAKVRLHLVMPPKTKALLDDLQQRTKAASMAEVIRKALALYDVLMAEQEQGRVLIVRDPHERDPRKADHHIMILNVR